jgi:uncharacterized protein
MRIAFEKQELTPKSGFDLSKPRTYYTRPMSPPWSKPLDVDGLADSGAGMECTVPLAELPGLRSLREGIQGEVRAELHFAREHGLPVAELRLTGSATLECQRCLRPLVLPLDTAARIALIGDEAQAARVPPDLEPVLAPGGRIRMGELIAEELLLTLPIVPLHGSPDGCAAEVPPLPPEAGGETQRPFAGLGALLKR